jgi:hypothetical protein
LLLGSNCKWNGIGPRKLDAVPSEETKGPFDSGSTQTYRIRQRCLTTEFNGLNWWVVATMDLIDRHVMWVVSVIAASVQPTPTDVLCVCADTALRMLMDMGWHIHSNWVLTPSAIGQDLKVGYERLPGGLADIDPIHAPADTEFFNTGAANLGVRGKSFAIKSKYLVRCRQLLLLAVAGCEDQRCVFSGKEFFLIYGKVIYTHFFSLLSTGG